MPWQVWLEIAVKATLLLSAAWACSWMLRRASAAARHVAWTACIFGLLALPVIVAVLPMMDAPRPAIAIAPARAIESIGELAPRSIAVDWPAWIMRIWAVGVAVFTLRLAIAIALLERTISGARLVRQPDWIEAARDAADALRLRRPVVVRMSGEVNMPVSCGLLRHTILIPESAPDWPPDRRRIVLLHEMAHAARFDPLTQTAAHLARCIYWFHPLMWVALRGMTMERERACDDRVLAAGAPPADYAGHLVEIARTLRGRKPWLGVAIAMASQSQLGPRLAAILDNRLRRRVLTRRFAGWALAGMAMVVLPLAAVRAQVTRGGAIAGVVYDGTGVVPNVRITLRNPATGQAWRTASGPAGGYRFRSVPAGSYEMLFEAPGFASHRASPVRLAEGVELTQAQTLRLGQVSESMEVVGERRAPEHPAAAQPHRIRVGGNIQPVRLVHQLPPRYPEEARAAGAQGDVVVRAVVKRDGTLGEATVLGAPHPALARAAQEALKGWLYEPALLNGSPVEVETTIQVKFRLTQ